MKTKNSDARLRMHSLLRDSLVASTPLLAAGLLLAGCTLESVDGQPIATEEEALIGGTQAAEYHMRATVQIADEPLTDYCTGAKVGPRLFLLAGHCVDDPAGGLSPRYAAGKTIRVSNSIVLNASATYHYLTIRKTTIHPTWTEACPTGCREPNVHTRTVPADVAVIEVAQDTPGIRQASVDLSTVQPGTWVVETGYGCEQTVGGPLANPPRYKTHTSQVVSSDQVLHPGSHFDTEEKADALGASYLLTAGQAQGTQTAPQASLCPGDSGGPLYRNDNTNLAVVGVNSNYSFPVDFQGVSLTDWHTRTSTWSRYNVGGWLKSLGVQTTGGGVNEGAGRISLERWNNVSGTSISAIPLTRTPSQTGQLTSFEVAQNSGDNYGVRVRGYLTAPTTGTYYFWIAGDDQASLSLSTDTSAANRRRIAYHTGYTAHREWNKYPTQRSGAIQLVAGRRYYIEALMKEGFGQDNLSVGWLQPTQSGTEPLQVIPGYQLSPM